MTIIWTDRQIESMLWQVSQGSAFQFVPPRWIVINQDYLKESITIEPKTTAGTAASDATDRRREEGGSHGT